MADWHAGCRHGRRNERPPELVSREATKRWIRRLLVQLVANSPTALLGLIFVGAVVALTLAGLLLVRYVLPIRYQTVDSGVAANVATIVCAIYAVLLAFVVVVVWQQWDDAQTKVQQEANALSNLFEQAGIFADPIRSELRTQIRDYTRAVVSDEWPDLATGQESSATSDALRRLRRSYHGLQITTTRDSLVYAQSLQQLDNVENFRRLRLLASRDSIPWILWVELIVGAVTTIVLTFFFGECHTTAQAFLTVTVALLIAVSLFLLIAMDNPYSGDVAVSNQAIAGLLNEWRGR